MFKFLAAKETDSVKPTTIRYIISPSSSKLPNTGVSRLNYTIPLSSSLASRSSLFIYLYRSYIFCPNEIYFMKEVRAAGKNFSAFFLIQPLIFLQFCTSVGQLEKKYAFFIPIGEKICISPPFSPLFYNIFSPIRYLAPFTHLKALIFRIKGRDVHFDKCCGGVLDSSFEELCGRYNIYQYCILN